MSIELYRAKLNESGISAEEAELLGLNYLSPSQTQALMHSVGNPAAIQIPYYDITAGLELSSETGEPFYRLRFLFDPLIAEVLRKSKAPKYKQPSGTSPKAYFPRVMDWKEIAADPKTDLIITEGEFKAAKACLIGFPTIGLGGVDAWRALKKGIIFLPSLAEINFKLRTVYICFDSDFRRKPSVCSALTTLAEELHDRGALTHILVLPDQSDDGKTGLDDFIVSAQGDPRELLRGLQKTALPIGLTRVLFSLNEKYCFIENPALVVNTTTGVCYPLQVFTGALESTKKYYEPSLSREGNIVYKSVSAAAAWARWPLRNQADHLIFSVGSPRYFDGAYNTWVDSNIPPKEGDVTPFFNLLSHVFSGETPEVVDWFLKWVAYPLQNKGAKMASAVLLHGTSQGTGKTLLATTIGALYGDNCVVVTQEELFGPFNSWAERKCFVVGDEISGARGRKEISHIKALVTQKKIMINRKHTPAYQVDDCINYIFTSQHGDAFRLERNDRRYFIHEVISGPLPASISDGIISWIAEGGLGALMDFFLKYNTHGISQNDFAIRTKSREKMISIGKSDIELWVTHLLEAPDYVLRVGGIVIKKDIFTLAELYAIYSYAEPNKYASLNEIAKALADNMIRPVNAGDNILTKDNNSAVYYPVRNYNHWITATKESIIAHLEVSNADKRIQLVR